MNMPKLFRDESGFLLPGVLSFIIAMTIFGTAMLMVIVNNFFVVGNNVARQKALNIAEAGVNYYMWHLSHNPDDYKDGNSTPSTPDPELGYGPYEHDYTDANGRKLGTYTLWLKPESSGSTIVNVRSIGKVEGSNVTRTLEAKVGSASFASYGLVINGALYVGETSVITGPIHSNIGIRMDGTNDSEVTSSNQTYVPPSNLGGNGSTPRPGVWCGAGTNCTQRNATNNNGTWRYPVPSADFVAITGDMCSIKKKAFAAVSSTASLANSPTACNNVSASRTAAYVPRYQSGYSAQRGWLIELNADGTYNLYSVAGETYNYTSNTNYTSTYTAALSETLVQSNIAITDAKVIFVEDNVWVRTNPTFSGRVTIASGRLASSSEKTNIIIADDIKYSTKNGEDAIGLVAEDNVIVAPYAPPRPNEPVSSFPFEINAALIAKDGDVGFTGTYGSNNRDVPHWDDSNRSLLYYGSIAVNGVAAWERTNGIDGDGFGYRETAYDYNLLFAPPPSFPITGSYQILSWREVLARP